MMAAITKVFCNARSITCCLEPEKRGNIRRRSHNYRTLPPGLVKVLVDELLDLAAPFANEANDDNIGTGKASHHAQQHTFTDTRAGKQTHPLSPADCDQAIDSTNSHIQHLLDGRALQGVDGWAVQRGYAALQRTKAIQRLTCAIHYAAQQLRSNRQGAGWSRLSCGLLMAAQYCA